MIRIICGTCSTSAGMFTSKSGTLSLPSEEEARLVRRCVAEYIMVPLRSDEDVATPCIEQKEASEGKDTANSAPIRDGLHLPENHHAHLDPEQLITLKMDELKNMAKEMDIDTTGLRSKRDYAEAIAAVEIYVDEEADIGNADLDLTIEDPVV